MSGLRHVLLGLSPEPVRYQTAWDEQRRVHAARVADEVPDTVLLLEHEPVYTAGARTARRLGAALGLQPPVVHGEQGRAAEDADAGLAQRQRRRDAKFP